MSLDLENDSSVPRNSYAILNGRSDTLSYNYIPPSTNNGQRWTNRMFPSSHGIFGVSWTSSVGKAWGVSILTFLLAFTLFITSLILFHNSHSSDEVHHTALKVNGANATTLIPHYLWNSLSEEIREFLKANHNEPVLKVFGSTNVMKGELLHMFCIRKSGENETKIAPIHWKFDGQKLDVESDKFGKSLYQLNTFAVIISRLTIAAVRGEDEGDYVCQSSHSNILKDVAQIKVKFGETDEWSVSTFNANEKAHRGQVMFQDEFDRWTPSNWVHANAASDAFQWYVDSRNNSFVRNGILYLKPTYTSDKYGEPYLFNGSLFLGHLPTDKCHTNPTSTLCWKKDTENEDIVHPIMAPLITTKTSFSFRYGKLEIRAKMPSGDWIEPLMSISPVDNVYGAGVLSGQINLIDIRGNRNLFNKENNVGSESNCPDVRYGTEANKRVLFFCLNRKPGDGYDRDFHTYRLEWTPERMTITIDDEGILSVPSPVESMYRLWSGKINYDDKNPWSSAENMKMAPFDKNFYISLGISVGGTTFFHEDFTGDYPKPWSNTDPKAALSFWNNRNKWEPSWANDSSAMQIDYVKVWAM